jgi:hypothetical protein
VIRGFLEVLGDLAVRRWGSPAARFGVRIFLFTFFCNATADSAAEPWVIVDLFSQFSLSLLGSWQPVS